MLRQLLLPLVTATNLCLLQGAGQRIMDWCGGEVRYSTTRCTVIERERDFACYA